MAEKIKYYDTSIIEKDELGQAVQEMMTSAQTARRQFERHAYDNNFFDDGYHYRYLSRQQNKIIDLTSKASLFSPMRAIPKASRQVRGVVNLLMSNDLIPVIYPEKIENNFEVEQEYLLALQEAKDVAKKSGRWIEKEFENQDIRNKLSLMGILTGKHFISYLQIFPDVENEKINTVVRDFFDVYLMGQLTELEDSPFVIIGHPKTIAAIKADERFDPVQREKINPDNRHASSDIKEAYMMSRWGRESKDDISATSILKEAFIKEHINANNLKRIRKQDNADDVLKGKDMGSVVLRQCFAAGNIYLSDKYVTLPGYPLVDLRFELGPMYGTPLIERFIPANKSLDNVVSRVERYTNTMPLGIVAKRQGEQFNITNQAGGQVVEYKNFPPRFEQQAPIPPTIFNFLEYLGGIIDEQGVTLSTLNKIPSGVKAAKAIESLKESEFSNLVIPSRMLKRTVKKIAEKFLDLADRYIISPQTVYYLEKGQPNYFDVIGKSAMEQREKLGVPVAKGVTPLSKDYKVDIEVQSGLAYTREGQKAAAKELGDYMIQLAQLGLLPPQAISKYLEVLLQAYQFGPTGEFMEEMEKFINSGGGSALTDQQMDAMKVAMAQVIKDTGMVQKDDTTDEDIQKTKIAVAEVAKDLQEGK